MKLGRSESHPVQPRVATEAQAFFSLLLSPCLRKDVTAGAIRHDPTRFDASSAALASSASFLHGPPAERGDESELRRSHGAPAAERGEPLLRSRDSRELKQSRAWQGVRQEAWRSRTAHTPLSQLLRCGAPRFRGSFACFRQQPCPATEGESHPSACGTGLRHDHCWLVLHTQLRPDGPHRSTDVLAACVCLPSCPLTQLQNSMMESSPSSQTETERERAERELVSSTLQCDRCRDSLFLSN